MVAEGREFWSYYLDTTNLEEGAHTIKVIGYDINENPVVSKPVVVTWQLDRKKPVTEIQGILNFTGKPDNFYNKARVGHTTVLPNGNGLPC